MEKKFQWTIMWNSPRGSENITLRTDEKKEFDTLKTEYRAEAHASVNPPMNTDDEKVTNFVAEYEVDANKCKKCGAQMVPGKGGKPYCVKCYIAWKEKNK
jgi:hypothetical protein